MKILIVKIGAIGDVIMSMSMIPVLRRKYPDAEISWICGRTAAPVLHMVTGIDHVIEVNDKMILTGSKFEKITALFNIWGKLFFQSFDIVINAHADYRYKMLFFPVRKKDLYSLRKDNSNRIRPVPGRHHSDEYAMLAENYDGENTLKYFLPDLKSSIKGKNEIHRSNNAPVVVLAPGGAKNILRDDNLRRWPVEAYAQLAESLLLLGYTVLVTGSETDQWVNPYFSKINVTSLIGKLGMQELVNLYSTSDLVITHDSGPLHFAGLAKTPVIALFGPTNPYEKVPRGDTNQIIWGGGSLSCRPCYDGRNYAPCSNNLCMKDITVEAVLKSVKEILNSSERK